MSYYKDMTLVRLRQKTLAGVLLTQLVDMLRQA